MPKKTTKKLSATEQFRASRQWPEGIPMPKAGAYRGRTLWEPEDEDLLREFYPKYGPIYAARLLGRTVYAVTLHANRMGVAIHPRWTDDEVETLKREYGKHGKRSSRKISSMIERKALGITQKAKSLGITRPPKAWSQREIKLLHTHYGTMPVAKLAKKIGRDVNSIRSMASVYGLSKPRPEITSAQKRFVARNAAKLPMAEIARRLGIPKSRVIAAADMLGVRSHYGHRRWQGESTQKPPDLSRHRREWTPEDDALIVEHYPKKGSRITAALLGRSWKATSERARSLGIRAEEFIGRWSEESNELLRTKYGTVPVEEIAAELNRTTAAVLARVHVLGLKVKET